MNTINVDSFELKDFENLTQGRWITFTCERCKKLATMYFKPTSHGKLFLHRYTAKLCNSCWDYKRRQANCDKIDVEYDDNFVFIIRSVEDLEKMHDKLSFKFHCRYCGKEVKTHYRRYSKKNDFDRYKTLLCQSCQLKYLANNRTPEEVARISSKTKQTKLKNHGDENYNNRNRFKSTVRTEYGSFGKMTGGKYYYYGVEFDSSWELAVWIYCTDHGIPIIREPCFFTFIDKYGDIKEYEPDFMINGKIIEIKGDQYFDKRTGKMIRPNKWNRRKHRPYTKSEIIYNNDTAERKHQCGLQHGVEFWRERDVKPYIQYAIFKFGMSKAAWMKLFRKDNPINPSYWCLNINDDGKYKQLYYFPKLTDSVSTFDKIDPDGYVVKGKGISPFDIPSSKEFKSNPIIPDSIINYNSDFTNYSLPVFANKGATPYDKPDPDGYVMSKRKGISPFDIPQLTKFKEENN